MTWIETLSDATRSLNRAWDTFKQAALETLGQQDPIQILPYRGYGTPQQIYLKGRVLQDEGIKLREENASIIKNLRNMYRRFETDEVPRAEVEARLGEQVQSVTADREGYIDIVFDLDQPVEAALWQDIHLKLLSEYDPKSESGPVEAVGESIIVGDRARFGVISDIDDTIVHTAATDLMRMIQIAYLGNTRTRRPFEGVPEFYQALQAGSSGSEGNPIFYVSSSAWNMYDLFAKFMDFNTIPAGPILLRDIELSLDNLLSFEHESHKREQIEPILRRFPNLPFMLIGDSGQRDAEIYQQLAKDFPDRICAIYIRNVTPNNAQRQQELGAIAQSLPQNVEFIVFDKTQKAAAHAAAQGWIR